MVICDSQRVNANVLVSSEWSRNPSTFQWAINFTQLKKNFTKFKKKITQFSREFDSIFGRIAQNFYENITQFFTRISRNLCGRLYTYRKVHKNDHEMRKIKSESEVFCVTCFAFRISQHFAPGSEFVWKIKRFHGLFFRDINKTRNSHEKCIVSVSYFVMFCENIPEIPAQCEIQKCIASLREFQFAFSF